RRPGRVPQSDPTAGALRGRDRQRDGTHHGKGTAVTNAMRVRRLAAPDEDQLRELAEVLRDCVDGGASVSFMHPLSSARALQFWRDVAAGVVRGERALLVGEDAAGAIVGTVQLVLAQPENQPHRA